MNNVEVAGDPGNLIDQTVEVVPAQYNTRSTQAVEVKSSGDIFDFALESR
jgi:hypothetical protein